MTITESRPVDWDKQRRKKRRRRLDSVDAGLVLVAAVLLGVGSHLFTDSLFRSHTDTVAMVSETTASTTVLGSGAPIELVLTPGIDGVITDHRTMTVTGTATPGANVSIGGLRSTSRSDGSWAITVLLKPGVNELAVDANGGGSSSTARNFTITYQPSATTTVPVAPTFGPTPTTVATTASATTAATTTSVVSTAPTTAPATTVAHPSTTRPRPPTTRTTAPPTTTPTTAPVPVDTEPKP
jgi:hypothetical protein